MLEGGASRREVQTKPTKKNSAQTLKGAFQLYSKWPLQTVKHVLKKTTETKLIERFKNECLPHRMLQQTHLFSQGCVFHRSCPHPTDNTHSEYAEESFLTGTIPAVTDSWFPTVVCVGVHVHLYFLNVGCCPTPFQHWSFWLPFPAFERTVFRKV